MPMIRSGVNCSPRNQMAATSVKMRLTCCTGAARLVPIARMAR